MRPPEPRASTLVHNAPNGIRTRDLREGFGLSQSDFASMGAIALGTVQGGENGASHRSGTHLKTLREFARLLDAYQH